MYIVRKLLIIMLIFPVQIFAQVHNWNIYAGSSIGGPMPLKMAENSYAKLKHGLSSGINYKLYEHNNFSVSAEFSFQYVHLNYGQYLKKDTSIQVQIPLQNGTILTTNINTYYKAYVDGTMKYNLFKAGSNFSYSKNKYNFTAGTYLSYLGGGFDKGSVYVTIGEGGVAGLENFEEKYSNNKGLNKFSFEMLLRTDYNIYKNFNLGLQLSRSLTPFYKNNFYIRGERLKFYNTIIGMYISYAFL